MFSCVVNKINTMEAAIIYLKDNNPTTRFSSYLFVRFEGFAGKQQRKGKMKEPRGG
jgi:hypothetical protein